jgi:hypothetical protein
MAPKMDAEGKPVTEFKGYERQAEFSDLQKQAMQGAKDMVGGKAEVANQSAQDIMKTAANTAAGSSYDPSAFGNQYTAPEKLDYTAKEATAKEAGIASLPTAQAATAATMAKAPTGIAAIGTAQQDTNAPQMTAQTGTAATGIAALNKATPEMKAQAANAATVGAAPEAAQQQFAGPKDVKAQQVGEERINAPKLNDLRMDAAKDISGSTVESRDIKAAKDTGLASLKNYQMGPAERVETKSFAQPGSADAYMSPYMQSVVGAQQREAQRAADVATTGRRGEQTRAGAFGGSRAAIMDAEAARNLAAQKGAIQSQGLNTAYTNAQQQFNADQARQQQAQQMYEQSRQYGAGLGMQGLQTALQGAGALGQLGQTQYGQQVGNINLQNQLGGQQQQQQQAILNQQIQNYATKQQYPMMQLANMSNLLRGMPMQSATTQGYQAQPSGLSQIAGLGATALGAYGASGGFKGAAGGSVKDIQNRPAGLAELALSKMT